MLLLMAFHIQESKNQSCQTCEILLSKDPYQVSILSPNSKVPMSYKAENANLFRHRSKNDASKSENRQEPYASEISLKSFACESKLSTDISTDAITLGKHHV